MSDPRTEEGKQLYVNHLERWKALEAEKEEAIDTAKVYGFDVEQVERSYEERFKAEEKIQEKERQALGKEPQKEYQEELNKKEESDLSVEQEQTDGAELNMTNEGHDPSEIYGHSQGAERETPQQDLEGRD